MDIEYTKIEDKPKDWPANEIELHLDNISNCLDEFVKNPNHETKEILISLVSNYDLNQQSHLGILRTTKYEVAQINSLFIKALTCNIPSLRVYLYELVGVKTRMQKMVSFSSKTPQNLEIPEFNGLIPQLHLYYVTYLTYILNNDKKYAECLFEYAQNIVEQENPTLQINFSIAFNAMLNDISYFSCKKTAEIWAFNRDEIYYLLKLVAKLNKLTNQNPIDRPLKGVLMTCISNYILKSRNNYNEDYVCKYVSPEVAVKSLKNKEVWISEIKNLNDEREQKVVPEIFKDNKLNTYTWAQNIDFTPQRTYYVSCFSKSINNEKMKKKYGSCIYGYKNDKIAEMISPITFLYNNEKIPFLSQVISFDVIYNKEEAKEELCFLCKIIDEFDIPAQDKKNFLEEILQYWILSVKDSKWSYENERRYVIFTYDNYKYNEIDLNAPKFLKIKSSLLLNPDFILGENPIKAHLKTIVDFKRYNIYKQKNYLYCPDCLSIDFDSILQKEKIKSCPICKSCNVTHENFNFL